jgi:hypothetical protein
MSGQLFRHMSEKKNSHSFLVSCFDVVCYRLSAVHIKWTSVTFYRLNDRAVRYTTALHTVFPE